MLASLTSRIWTLRWLAAAVAASVAGVGLAAAPVAAETPSPVDELLVETPFWSGVVADAVLEASPDLDANPYAVLVRFQDGVNAADAVDLLDAVDGRIVGAHQLEAHGPEVHVVETRAGLDLALERLRASDLVISAEPDQVVEVDAVSNDTYAGAQWGLEDGAGIDIVPAWAAAAGADTVVVGVIDSGVDLDHPDLDGVAWVNEGEIAGNGIDDDGNGYIDDVHGWDFVDGDADPSDPNGHGTHVAGTVAAEIGNGTGVAGVAPNVEIMALRFLNASGSGYTSDAIAALEYALDLDVPITNNSWGGGSYNWTLDSLISGASDHLFVTSAGNSALDIDASPAYPAAYAAPNILSVASHTSAGGLSSFSNSGSGSVDVSAPGSAIVSTRAGFYGYSSGTSMASPHVAGVAAILKGIDPSLTPTEIIDIILDTSRWDHASVIQGTRSGGHVDAARAAAAADPAGPEIAISDAPVTAMAGGVVNVSATAGPRVSADDIVWVAESEDGTLAGSVVGTGGSVSFAAGDAGRLRISAEVTDGDGRWSIDTALLDVVDAAPSAPLDVSVVPGDESLDVSWAVPASAGSSPIVGYVATAQPHGSSCESSSTSCVIEGLAHDAEYTVTVVASNGVGDGVPSSPFGPISPAVAPGAPTALVASADDHEVVVSWQPPVDDGGAPIQSYVVTIEPGTITCVATDALTCVFEASPNGVVHTVSVAAVNAAGTGPSASGPVVTPSPASGPCAGESASSSFVDVSASSFAAADVECLVALGVTNGTSATTYSPGDVVTREQMAAFLGRLYRAITEH